MVSVNGYAMLEDTFIIDLVRTPIGLGAPDGILYESSALSLVATCVNHFLGKYHLDRQNIAELYLGCTLPERDQAANLGKAATLKCGLNHVLATQIDQFELSGLAAIKLADCQAKLNPGQLLLAGGVESMSRVGSPGESGAWYSNWSLVNENAIVPPHWYANVLAAFCHYGKDDLVRYYDELTTGGNSTALSQYLISVKDQNGWDICNRDEWIAEVQERNKDVDMAQSKTFEAMLIKQFPTFEAIPAIHSGLPNYVGGDGAAMALLGGTTALHQSGLTPIARIKSWGTASVAPKQCWLGAKKAAEIAIQQAGLVKDDIGAWTCLDLFPAFGLYYRDVFKVSKEKWNEAGSSLTKPTPMGAIGAMLLVNLLEAMAKNNQKHGVCIIPSCSGMGMAMVLERYH